MTAIRTRPPTGRVPWPLILLEGGEKSGKSWTAAEFSASERIGQMYWLDLGEGAADEYGAIPGARYLVLEHDGTWAQIMTQVKAVRDEAARVAAAGKPPVVLTIDSMTAEWDMHKDWANNRAAKSDYNRKRLAADPDAEIKVPVNLWNDANARHQRLMTILMTFPGIVIVTARGKEVVAMDDSGKPIEGGKGYKVEGHKNLAYDCSVWVRLSRERPPVVVGARSVHAGIRHGVDPAKALPENWNLEALIFQVLRCDQSSSHPRNLTPVVAGSESPDADDLSEDAAALLGRVEDSATLADLSACWDAIGVHLRAKKISKAEADRIADRITALRGELNGDERPAEPLVSGEARELMQFVEGAESVTGLETAWRAITAALNAKQMTKAEADRLRARVQARKAELNGAAA